MDSLPRTSDSLLVRTAATPADEWINLVVAVRTENAHGFRAYVQIVDDARWYGATEDDVRSAIPDNDEGASVLFIADDITLTTEGSPVLVVDLQKGRPSFRCVAADLWAVDNNLNIANVDWEDFADEADEQGVYRSEPLVPPAERSATVAREIAAWPTQVDARRQLGENFTAPRPVEHFAYFRSRRSADAAADDLRSRGFTVAIHRLGLRLILVATRVETLTDASVATFLTEVIGVVEARKGDYDGWGANVEVRDA
ncbi:ribonuclease E inhibitor RraB [Microbacterium testaceum]|uniref:ribonuclease E inhibitor RraB n=1 Tax=Microbacterium testaceum TaxID=2033 RepID=UPI000A4928FB|nr:ribonuclease E inhibitor RraB [Microbacterium testaceum]